MFYYSTGVFKEAGIPDESVRYATLGTGAINVAMTIVAVGLLHFKSSESSKCVDLNFSLYLGRCHYGRPCVPVGIHLK